MQLLSVSPQIECDVLINDGRANSKTRQEIAKRCDPMIDLMPHLNSYVRCLGKVVDKARALYEPEHDAAVATQPPS
jgi:hypothetical protein